VGLHLPFPGFTLFVAGQDNPATIRKQRPPAPTDLVLDIKGEVSFITAVDVNDAETAMGVEKEARY
jgi:hypothetical protein